MQPIISYNYISQICRYILSYIIDCPVTDHTGVDVGLSIFFAGMLRTRCCILRLKVEPENCNTTVDKNLILY